MYRKGEPEAQYERDANSHTGFRVNNKLHGSTIRRGSAMTQCHLSCRNWSKISRIQEAIIWCDLALLRHKFEVLWLWHYILSCLLICGETSFDNDKWYKRELTWEILMDVHIFSCPREKIQDDEKYSQFSWCVCARTHTQSHFSHVLFYLAVCEQVQFYFHMYILQNTVNAKKCISQIFNNYFNSKGWLSSSMSKL